MEFIDNHIIVCGIPHYDSEQTTEHPKTTPIIMTTNNPTTHEQTTEHISTIMNDNNPTTHEQTTEHISTIMNDNNPTTEAQTTEQIIINGIVTIGTAKGARTLSTLERIHALNESGMVYTASHAVFNFAKNAGKRFGFTLESDIELIANLVMSNLNMLIDRIIEEKPTKTTTRKSGIVDTACLNYATGIIRGDILKNARVAKNCKDLALKMLVNPGFDVNDLPLSIDTLANKVYASIRSQATKNGEQFAKSNTATKNAVKTALIETIEALRLEHGTEYEILIDNMPKQPKHLSI